MPVLNETGGLDATIQLHDGTVITREELFEEVKHFVRGEELAKVKGFGGAKWLQRNWVVVKASTPVGDEVTPVVDSKNLCGTAMCVAGWTCVAEAGLGAMGAYSQEEDRRVPLLDLTAKAYSTVSYGDELGDGQWIASGGVYNKQHDLYEDFSDHATELLGLSGWQAEQLFAGHNDASDVCRILDEVAWRMRENA